MYNGRRTEGSDGSVHTWCPLVRTVQMLYRCCTDVASHVLLDSDAGAMVDLEMWPVSLQETRQLQWDTERRESYGGRVRCCGGEGEWLTINNADLPGLWSLYCTVTASSLHRSQLATDRQTDRQKDVVLVSAVVIHHWIAAVIAIVYPILRHKHLDASQSFISCLLIHSVVVPQSFFESQRKRIGHKQINNNSVCPHGE